MRTIASARKLVEQDKVVALLAVTGTAPSAALLPFVTESKTPMLFPYAFAHSLTTPLNRDVFTTLPEVRVQMMVLANYILKDAQADQGRGDLPERRFRPGCGRRPRRALRPRQDAAGQAAVRSRHDQFQRRRRAGQGGRRRARGVPRHPEGCRAGHARGEQSRLEAAVQRPQRARRSPDLPARRPAWRKAPSPSR